MAKLKKEIQLGAKMPVILIVDDDLATLERLQRTLEDSYDVYTSSSGVEAIHIIKTLPEIDVLIFRDELPQMKGSELLRFVHEIFPNSDRIIKILITDNSANSTVIDLAIYGNIDFCFATSADPTAIRHKVNYLIAQKSKEKRSSMRVKINGSSDIQIEAGSSSEAQVVNISENGMFLKTASFYPERSALPLKITLPDGRQYDINGRIVRQDLDQGGIGVEFQAVDETSRYSILQFLYDYVSLRDLSELKLRYPFLKTDKMVLFSDFNKIESLMRAAMSPGLEIVAIHAQSRNPEIVKLADIKPGISCVLVGEKMNIKFKTSDILFISFQIGYATYNFETIVSRISPDGKSLVCLYPKVMFYSEKRAAQRIIPKGELFVEIDLPPPFEGVIRGKIIDISREGMSFATEASFPALLSGTPLESLRVMEGTALLWEETGEIRNVSRVDRKQTSPLRYGIQFGIGRATIQSTRAPDIQGSFKSDDFLRKEKSDFDYHKHSEWSGHDHLKPSIIRLENHKGEEIVGLLNSSLPLDENPVPVILIPPAFGKTKETLFGLALTIIQNFSLQKKPVAILRYDGIRRKGESHKDPDASEPPFEMVKASLSQGAEDIKAVLDWLQLNSKLRASSVILVTFSLSALEARIALRNDVYRHRIHYWISCMGTLEFRHLMNRVNCGLDLLEQYQIGMDLGVIPILGNLINMVPYASDVVSSGVATLDQAREDMRHLDLPITWIYGEYDKWINPEFIRDVMSIQANAEREVISMPIGHNARTSEEALRLFALITSLAHRFLYDEMIPTKTPSKAAMEFLRRAEKDRLPARKLKNRKSYWRRYLVGEENLLGYDVMELSDDYQQLISDQLQALDLTTEDRLLDLGGGTGNVIEYLLNNNCQPIPAHITIADLIPEALQQAEHKLSRFEVLNEPGRFNRVCLDIELNRFLPVQRFLNGEIGDFVELADKIENMDLESAQHIQDLYSPRLHRILRGELITPKLDDWLKAQFELSEYKIIVDFNNASRYVLRLTDKIPLFRKLLFSESLDANPHLPFRAGYFDKILMSLVLSYIFDPLETLYELRHLIKPNGRLVLSSMLPDTDASGPFSRLLDKIEAMPTEALPPQWPKPLLLDSLRSFLNDAQALVDLEEAGTFDFFDPEKLDTLLEQSGWERLKFIPTFGEPPQGYIVIAKPRITNG